MIPLTELLKSPDALSRGLRENAGRHLYFNLYTSMERAMALLLTGELYLSNGGKWNDVPDQKQMKAHGAYGMCLSCSTLENVAMWMLYSGDRGKNGAMVKIPRAVIHEILAASELELVCKVEKDGKYHTISTLSKDDFEIYLTDVLYTENMKDGKIRLTYWNQFEIANRSLVENAQVFCKDYAWRYEYETRLIIELSDHAKDIADSTGGILRLRLSRKSRNALQKQVFRSPIFKGGVDFGNPSALHNKVEWDL